MDVLKRGTDLTAQSLPFEIIRQILKHFSTTLILHVLYTPRVSVFPWYLGHICSSWRTVFTLMTEEFWCRYKLRLFFASDYTNSNNIIAQTTLFPQHSEGRLFSFEIEGRGSPDSKLFTQILRLFVERSLCWQEASITITDDQIPLLAVVKKRVPFMRSLELVVAAPLITFSAPPAVPVIPAGCEDIFLDAPCLTRITLSGLSSWRFNWSIVTSLCLTNRAIVANNDQLLANLLRMVNLEELSIYAIIPLVLNQDWNTLITLPRLRFLTVSQPDILSYLNTPNLEQFCIHSQAVRSDWNSFNPVFSSFFDRASNHLQYLAFGRCTSAALDTILPHVSQLRSVGICLDVHGAHGQCFRGLAYSPERQLQIIVPNLETLRIFCDHLRATGANKINNMILSRTIERPNFVQPLKQIIFTTWQEQLVFSKRNLDLLEQQCRLCNVEFILVLAPASAEGYIDFLT